MCGTKSCAILGHIENDIFLRGSLICQRTVLCYNEHRKDFVNFCKFTMKRQMLPEIIGLSAFWVTEILTAVLTANTDTMFAQ